MQISALAETARVVDRYPKNVQYECILKKGGGEDRKMMKRTALMMIYGK